MINYHVPTGTAVVTCEACQKRCATIQNRHDGLVVVEIGAQPAKPEPITHRPPLVCNRANCPMLRPAQSPAAPPSSAPSAPPEIKAPRGTKPCAGCGAPILWDVTKNGKRAPMNLDGTSHFSTCPKAKAFSGKGDLPRTAWDGDNDSPNAARKTAGSVTVLPVATPPAKTIFRKVILSSEDFGAVCNGTPLRRAWGTPWRDWIAFGDGSKIVGVARLVSVSPTTRDGFLWEFADFRHIEIAYMHNANDRCEGIYPPLPVRWNDDAQRMLNALFTPLEAVSVITQPEPVITQPEPVFEGQGSLF